MNPNPDTRTPDRHARLRAELNLLVFIKDALESDPRQRLRVAFIEAVRDAINNGGLSHGSVEAIIASIHDLGVSK